MMKMKQILALFVVLAFVNVSAEIVHVRILGTRSGSQELNVPTNATIADLKEAIQHQLGIPVEIQERIIFSNKILKNDAELLGNAVGGDMAGRNFYLKLK